jgi:hypothetical protein
MQNFGRVFPFVYIYYFDRVWKAGQKCVLFRFDYYLTDENAKESWMTTNVIYAALYHFYINS